MGCLSMVSIAILALDFMASIWLGTTLARQVKVGMRLMLGTTKNINKMQLFWVPD
jgi:hypothetical protein